MKKQIDLMIAGAQKAGTTSLNIYLSQHPKIYTHTTIEFGMFASLEAYNKGFDYYYKNTVADKAKQNYNKSVFAAKRVGLMCNKELLIKLKEHNPDVKIIIVLRNPIDRAYSAFNYCRNSGMEPYSEFNDAVFINDSARFKGDMAIKKNCEYVFRSNYLQHLHLVYSIFPQDNVKLFLFEEMIQNYNKYLNEMIQFLKLDKYDFDVSKKHNERRMLKSSFLSEIISPGKNKILKNIVPLQFRTKFKFFLNNLNTSKKKEENLQPMDDNTREYLKNLFKKDIYELKRFTKLPLEIYWLEFF